MSKESCLLFYQNEGTADMLTGAILHRMDFLISTHPFYYTAEFLPLFIAEICCRVPVCNYFTWIVHAHGAVISGDNDARASRQQFARSASKRANDRTRIW
ncbi:MAG: hypothetical protein R2794_04465 [Chitinophagales bacterium]